MKFRKISEDKIQIILTAQDLEERDFRRWEMMPMSPKLQEFFHDLLERAHKECGFEISEDFQLIVEAYPLNSEAFAIILTRIPAGSHRDAHGSINIGNIDRDFEDETEEYERDCHQVWVFDELEDCVLACSRLDPSKVDESSLYKFEGSYFLALQTTKEGQIDANAVMGEYGQWSFVPKPYFAEYGHPLIKDHALVNLAALVRPNANHKPDIKPKSKTDINPEIKPKNKAEIKPENKPKTKAKIKPEIKPEI